MYETYMQIFQNMQEECRARSLAKSAVLPQRIKSDDYWEQDYRAQPPDLNEFITNSRWLGGVLLPREDNPGLFPLWRDLLLRDFNVASAVHNLVITGSLGIGKTYVMVTVLLYRLVLATLLKNPANFFGLSKGSKLVYNVLSVTKSQVQETAFGDARNFMAQSEYFVKECNFDPDSKYSNFRIELPGDILFTAGSKGWHVLGRNVLGVALDEGNWRQEKDPDIRAYELYNEVRIRIANRFLRSTKFLPAISILASSARDETSFTEQVIKEISEAKDPEHQLVYRFPVYKIKKHLNRYCGEHFKVCYGLKTQDPYVMTGRYAEDGTKLPSDEPHEDTPAGASTELVPVEFLADFKRHAKVALQSVSGISTGGSNRFFSSPLDIERCIDLAEHDGVVDPARPGVKSMSISSEDDLNIWDYLDVNKFLTKRQSRVEPKRHPNMARFAHLDLATQTMAGLAVCHLVSSRLVEGLVDLKGNPLSEYRLIVEYDFILTITAGRTKPISLEKIQNFFIWLTNRCGYRFGLITADQYQSAMPLQMLESRDFKVALLSVDRDKKVYHSWRQAFEELRLRPYRQDQMIQEAERLVDGDKKIDHPKDGSKDTSDAAAGCYFNAISSDEKFSVSIDNSPSIHGNTALSARTTELPPVDIPLPLGYDKIRTIS